MKINYNDVTSSLEEYCTGTHIDGAIIEIRNEDWQEKEDARLAEECSKFQIGDKVCLTEKGKKHFGYDIRGEVVKKRKDNPWLRVKTDKDTSNYEPTLFCQELLK